MNRTIGKTPNFPNEMLNNHRILKGALPREKLPLILQINICDLIKRLRLALVNDPASKLIMLNRDNSIADGLGENAVA